MEKNGFDISKGLIGAGVVFLVIGLILGFTPMDPTTGSLDCGSVFSQTKKGQLIRDGELCDFSTRTTFVTLLFIGGGLSFLIGYFGKQKN